jgi:hypothetical protein
VGGFEEGDLDFVYRDFRKIFVEVLPKIVAKLRGELDGV